jgi:hypothetical protein
MMSGRHRSIVGISALVLAMLLGLAVPSVAQAASGTGVIVEKDLAMGRLTLHTGVVLEVGDHTRLLSARGRHITLADFEVAPRKFGLVQVYAPAMVSYAGREHSGVVAATMVRVKGTIPE